MAEQKQPAAEKNLLSKLYNREIHGSDRCHRKARPQRLFKRIPKRLCYRLSRLVSDTVLEEGHVFLGFTKCGQFVVSYTLQMDESERTGLPFYTYKLHWWWFVPSRPLVKISEVRLFGEQDILYDLYVLFCEWPEDSSQVLVFGHSMPGTDVLASPGREHAQYECYITVTAVPPLIPCKSCRDIQSGSDDIALCLKHSFCYHTKYEPTPPFPVFHPRIQLKCDGQVILNTGDSIVALHIDLDGIDSKSKGPGSVSSLVLKSKESLVSEKTKEKEMLCSSPEPNKEFIWTCGALNTPVPLSGEVGAQDLQPSCANMKFESESVLDVTLVACSDPESQKENTSGNVQDITCKMDRIKSPKSPKNSVSQNQKSPVHSGEKWFEGLNTTTSPTQPSRRTRTNSVDSHTAKDLYSFDSDDSEDSGYSFMCPSIPKVTLKTKSTSGASVSPHLLSHVISPSVQLQRQLAFGGSKASPLLNNSQALNCSGNSESPRQTLEHMLAARGMTAVQRPFFSPSNSEKSFGGTSSSAESVIVQVNDARTVMHSWRKFSYHGDTDVDSTQVVEDDFDLSYRCMLPAEVRGTKSRQLSPSLDPSNDGNKEQICIKQLTFDIEHYMEEAIRSAKWADRYIAFTDYDLQIIDVYPDSSEVLAKVYALISAREESKQRKFYKNKRSKGQEKLYQTSFVFEVNVQSGTYETLSVDDLELLREKPGKEWKPGFKECALLRQQAFIPQSARCVNVLSNESVFRGKSLQMIMSPDMYTVIIL